MLDPHDPANLIRTDVQPREHLPVHRADGGQPPEQNSLVIGVIVVEGVLLIIELETLESEEAIHSADSRLDV